MIPRSGYFGPVLIRIQKSKSRLIHVDAKHWVNVSAGVSNPHSFNTDQPTKICLFPESHEINLIPT
jgi:hypothetical protein